MVAGLIAKFQNNPWSSVWEAISRDDRGLDDDGWNNMGYYQRYVLKNLGVNQYMWNIETASLFPNLFWLVILLCKAYV